MAQTEAAEESAGLGSLLRRITSNQTQQPTAPASAQQLLAMPEAVPFYQQNPKCPGCSTETTPMGASDGAAGWHAMCAICSEGASGGFGDPWAMPAHACRSCGFVVCAACNQNLRVEALIEESKERILAEVTPEMAPAEAAAEAAEHELGESRAELAAAVAEVSESRLEAASAEKEAEAEINELQAEAATQREALNSEVSAVRAQIASRSQETRVVEDEIARTEADIAELTRVAEEAERRVAEQFPGIAKSPEEARAARAAALATEVEQAAAEAAAAAVRSTEADAEKQSSVARSADLRAEAAIVRGETRLIPDNSRDLEELREKIAAVRALHPAVPLEACSAEEDPGFRRFFNRVQDFVQHVAGSEDDGGGGGDAAALQGKVNAMQEQTGEQMAMINDVHDELSSRVNEAMALRAQANELSNTVKAESAQCGRLRAELGVERTEAPARRAVLQAGFEAQFRAYQEQALAALSASPPADADGPAGAMDAIMQRLAEIERQALAGRFHDGSDIDRLFADDVDWTSSASASGPTAQGSGEGSGPM